MIDTVLNNFVEFQANPLYVNFDKFDLSTQQFGGLMHGQLIKTHYPHEGENDTQNQRLESLQEFTDLKVICIHRKLEDSLKSYNEMFELSQTLKEYAQVDQKFREYWASFDPLEIEFNELIDINSIDVLLHKIEKHLGLAAINKKLAPTPKRSKARIYMYKLLTRIFGFRSPIINTGIRFSKVKDK